MSYYGFEYFCGANVVVSVEGLPILEAAGLQYEINDSKMPLYGYSSRHYDAVAAGQVIVHGTLIVNFIHQDYVFRAIQRGLGQISNPPREPQVLIPAEEADLSALAADFDQASSFIANMRGQYWQTISESGGQRLNDTRSPHDFLGGIDITVAFGAQSALKPAGQTAFLLRDVHFTGRSNVIRIDEEVIVEAYPFFARDVYSMRNPYKVGTVTEDALNATAMQGQIVNSIESQ